MKSLALRIRKISVPLVVFGFAMAANGQQAGPTPAPKNPPAAQTTARHENGAAPTSPANRSKTDSPETKQDAKVVVPVGTHIPLVLHNAISTRTARKGDPVYCETLFPILVNGHVVIPAGSYVSGEVTESKKPGRIHGRAKLMIKLTTLILPNAYIVKLNAVPGGDIGTGGNETINREGEIKGDSNKAGDAGTVVHTTEAGTAVGAGVGAASGNIGRGVGIGAGAGAVAGLAAVLLSRGPEAVLPRGTTLEAVLDHPLYLDASKVHFKTPGQASTLAGPPNREPQRRRSPF